MVYLDVDKLDNIISCKILNGEDLKFENGLAVAHVYVKGKDFWNNKNNYDTYTIIKEVKDEKTNEVVDYELVNQDDSRFRLLEFVKGIARTGNHFLFSILTGDDSSDVGSVSWTNYWHYEYDEKTETFTQIGKLKGKPTITKNPDLVILNDSQLYSLSKKDYVSDSYYSIEDINGEKFFVTDSISSKETENGKLKNQLMFDIDKNGKRISNVYSRNAGEPTEDNLDIPYEEIKTREIEKLNDLLDKSNTYKLLLKIEENEQ